MGYALFAQRKVVLTGNLNSVTLQQTQRSNEQYLLATQSLSLQQQLSSIQAAQSLELSAYYEVLAHVGENGVEQEFIDDVNNDKNNKHYSQSIHDLVNRKELTRDNINAAIKAKENEFNKELDAINRQIYLVSVKENALEMEVKRLDTQVSALQKQLEAVEEAEGSAIDRATPKFNGVG